ncbi:MAG TPA: hypothetical protein VI953_02450 [Candidatus Paceibacterota bacterium]
MLKFNRGTGWLEGGFSVEKDNERVGILHANPEARQGQFTLQTRITSREQDPDFTAEELRLIADKLDKLNAKRGKSKPCKKATHKISKRDEGRDLVGGARSRA